MFHLPDTFQFQEKSETEEEIKFKNIKSEYQEKKNKPQNEKREV